MSQDGKGVESGGTLSVLPVGGPPETVDELWRQIMVYKTFADADLSEAKMRRAQAEAARDKAEQETAATTRRLYEGLKSEAGSKLAEADALKSEAQLALEGAQLESRRARKVVAEAEAERDRILAEAKQKGSEILEQARETAQRETTELRQQALREIKEILGRVEGLRAAADEELETQRILTDITKLKSNSAALMLEPNPASDGALVQAGDHSSNGAATATEVAPQPEQPESPGVAQQAPQAERPEVAPQAPQPESPEVAPQAELPGSPEVTSQAEQPESPNTGDPAPTARRRRSRSTKADAPAKGKRNKGSS